ncbi:protein kinase [Streptomyces sp. NPDC059816]|uniref:serine/threonine-protein kinase n=1 Tax=Streptomyces sp. NPDC059816 TaxID=3346960 RepID=UPI00365D87A7
MGEVFAGRYELVDPIGRGGVGAVWRAWDHRRRRYVAAKVLQQSDAHTLLRFVREQALRIDHPHVLAPASWAADDDKVLFTMDLVAGGSLAHLIGDYGPLPPRFVCTLLDQLLSGLAAVHAEGVVHRDIKPANVLLEATGSGRPHLRLSDFGISMRKGEPRLTETDYVVGTPGYFAPEQMLGAEPDFPADLFAVGLVALYLLQGAKPDAKALIEHFAAHGTPSAPRDVDEPLWQVVAGLLQPDPQARFRTATGARKALVSAAEMLPEPGPDDELVEVFDQIGPLPTGFGPEGPEVRAKGAPHALHQPGDLHTAGRSSIGHTPDPRPTPASPPTTDSAAVPGAGPTPTGSGTPPPAPWTSAPYPPLPAPAPAPPVPGTPPGPGTSAGVPHGAPTGPRPAASAVSATGSFLLPPPPPIAPAPSEPPTGQASGGAAPAPPVPAHTPYYPQSPSSPDPHPPRPQDPPQSAAHHEFPAGPGTPHRPPAGYPPYSRPAPYPVPPGYTGRPTDPVAFAGADTAQGHGEPAATAPYTAGAVRAARPVTAPPPGHRRRRRPGPPPKVTFPVLALALLCFAVGIWALGRI